MQKLQVSQQGTQSIYRIKSIRLAYSAVEYDGTAKKPAVEVKDSKGRKVAAGNYSVSYSNNKNIGKAKVVIKFKGDYEGRRHSHLTSRWV